VIEHAEPLGYFFLVERFLEYHIAREDKMAPLHFRSLWISDIHLGTRSLQSRKLLDFLSSTESEYLYLVGDILDLQQAKRSWHWPKINDRIVQAVFDKAANGTRVFYVPGNHDQLLRNYDGTRVKNIEITNQVIHETASGQRYLVLHGDKFDCVIQNSPWLATIGSISYDLLLIANRWINNCRKFFGLEYRSISSWLKHQTKVVVNYIGKFEEVVVREVEDNGVDGLICGHIHQAAVKNIGNILYTNSGDWVESCTALAENHDGTLGVIEWVTPQMGATLAYDDNKDMYRNRCLASTN